ncbi:OLC1v1025121C2 [Oldenlandia corymbosa var. corymbosa]|uniref:Protein artemis n=1 Tax=Oldenlandia corymbosa var. corymbosa TaxID=529605 RepID=A0AAV1C700_OLDCO|nr:OLC1v1025121C2 [Oldenlandia corymbosa var. corymbosa]
MERGMISVDRWAQGSQAYFLTHLHADHTVGLTPTWKWGPLFCSQVTAKLFLTKFDQFNKLSLLRILDLGRWYSLPLFSPSSGQPVTIQVMAIDAHHCPGAVMYLFRGEFGCMLYTGDFRWETVDPRAEIARGMLLEALKGVKLDILYLDNTYCDPSYCFPSREDASRQVVDIISSHPNHDIVISIDSLGKEDLLFYISKKLKTKDIFTTNTSLTRIRAIPRYSFSMETLQALNLMRPTVGIMPSGLPWMKKIFSGPGNVVGPSPSHGVTCSKTRKQNGVLAITEICNEYIYTVPYSDHSCFSEIKKFVELLQPTDIRGTVSSSPSNVEPRNFFGNQKPFGEVRAGKHEGPQVRSPIETVESILARRERIIKRCGRLISRHFISRLDRVRLLRRLRRGIKITDSEFSP